MKIKKLESKKITPYIVSLKSIKGNKEQIDKLVHRGHPDEHKRFLEFVEGLKNKKPDYWRIGEVITTATDYNGKYDGITLMTIIVVRRILYGILGDKYDYSFFDIELELFSTIKEIPDNNRIVYSPEGFHNTINYFPTGFPMKIEPFFFEEYNSIYIPNISIEKTNLYEIKFDNSYIKQTMTDLIYEDDMLGNFGYEIGLDY
jgi:hypothetical protein